MSEKKVTPAGAPVDEVNIVEIPARAEEIPAPRPVQMVEEFGRCVIECLPGWRGTRVPISQMDQYQRMGVDLVRRGDPRVTNAATFLDHPATDGGAAYLSAGMDTIVGVLGAEEYAAMLGRRDKALDQLMNDGDGEMKSSRRTLKRGPVAA